jgi:hypothetical protein
MELYDSIALTKEFEPQKNLQESSAPRVQDHTMDVSLGVMEHLKEAAPAATVPVQLGALPVPN